MATLIIEHSDLAGSGRFGEILRDHGHRLIVVRVHRGDAIPGDLRQVDGVVVFGGPQSPTDDEHDFIAAELDLMRAAHEASIPIVGICLGSQLLGRALGGEVGRIPWHETQVQDEGLRRKLAEGTPPEEGIECGWHEVSLTGAGRVDPLFFGIAGRSVQLHWHRYYLKKLPPGVRVLATSISTPVQAWAVGSRTYGIQYHPEAFEQTADVWAEDEPETLKEIGTTREVMRQQAEQHFPAFARLAERLGRSIAMVLMPIDKRNL